LREGNRNYQIAASIPSNFLHYILLEEIDLPNNETTLSLFLYNIFLLLYRMGISFAALLNPKAKQWIQGRKSIFIKFKSEVNSAHPLIWMHCASLGEFEQGRPLLERIKKEYPDHKVLVTFFSPSGYEIVKNYRGADHIFYLPHDSAGNAKKFIELINPTIVLWIRYEYWFYYLRYLKEKNIPVLLITAIFRRDMPFFKWYGSFWKKMLDCFTHFFVQNERSKKVLSSVVDEKLISVSGDTRFDRVIAIAERFEPVEGMEKFCGSDKVIVAGSTWEDDEAEWTHYVKTHTELKFIIAPHEIDKENLKDVKKQFPNSVFYSAWIANQNPLSFENSAKNDHRSPSVNCLIIDNIGMLGRLYSYANITYVGGGFGYDGLHNILEAAVYGKPVIFGPEYEKNFEAIELLSSGGGIAIESALDLEKTLQELLPDEAELKKRGEAAKNYVYNNAGATGRIFEFIQAKRLLTR
jgi:3-deoxy-D-manno-octulosonic-acid transferase